MSDNGDPQLRIDATINAGGAVSGGKQTVDALNQVKEATERGAQSAKEAGETFNSAILGNLRSVHHLLAGLFEISEGGIPAIGGLAAEGRVTTEVFEGMLGAFAPLALIITTITQLAIPMFEAWAARGEKAKDATDGVKTATDGYKTSLDAVIQAQNRIIDIDNKQLQLLQKRQAEEKKLIEIQRDAAIERARSDYLSKLTPDTSQKDRNRLKEQFEAIKSDITGRSTVATAELEVKNQTEDLAQATKKLQDLKDSQAFLLARINEAQDQTASARNFLSNNGLVVDQNNKVWKDEGNGTQLDIEKFAEDHIKSGQTEVNRIRENLRKGQYMPRDEENEKKLIAQWQDQIDKASQLLAEIRIAVQDAPKYAATVEKYSPEITKQDASISAAHDDIDHIKEQLDLAVLELSNVRQTAANDHLEHQKNLGFEDQKDEKDEADRNAAGDLEARITRLEIIAKDESQPSASRESAQRQIGELQAQKERLQLHKEDLTPGEKNAINAKAEADIAAGGFGAQHTQTQQQKQSAEQLKHDQERQIGQFKAAIEATGNKDLIKQLKEIALRDHDDLAKELADLMTIQITQQTAINAQTRASIEALKRSIRSARNGGNN